MRERTYHYQGHIFRKDDVGLYSIEGEVHKAADEHPKLRNLKETKHYLAMARGVGRNRSLRRRLKKENDK